VVVTNITKPYIVRRCAILRFVLQNSAEVRTSSATVFKAIEAFSPVLTGLVANFFAFSEFLKKNLALCL